MNNDLVARDARVFVAGGGTMVGAALLRQLRGHGFTNIVDPANEPALGDRIEVEAFVQREKPSTVFVAAGRTAGIAGNQRFPADLMLDNLLVATHVIPAVVRAGVQRLLYLSSSCTYPKAAPHPLSPDSLWTGPLEPTSAAYAVSKLAGVTLAQAYRRQHGARFISAISADAYGPGDDFDPEHAHVVGALLRRMHEAKHAAAPSVDVWGSGSPRREFIYVDDLADACIFAMDHYDGDAPINLGVGESTSIGDLANAVRDVVGYRGDLRFDSSKPDGMPFKGLDSTVLKDLGWMPSTSLRDGLMRTYEWFLASRR
jgi:GDP-L-fucose synthase